MDDVVRSLLLDPHDTAVTDATAAALLERGDLAALRLFAYVWSVAGAEHSDLLSGALSGALFTLSCGPPLDRVRFRSVLHELLVDDDLVVRGGARDLWARTARALPD